MFGAQLRQAAESAGICMDYLLEDEAVHTTLAFVKTFPNGDRDFSFYREPGADMMLRADELPQEALQSARIFHFGTLSMTHPEVRFATRKAVTLAKEAKALISFDPNLRPPLWHDLEEAREQIAWGLSRCDILKIADNELEFMTGETDYDKGAAALRRRYPNIRLLNVTAGAEGSYSYYGDKRVFVPAFRLGGTIETTGAGGHLLCLRPELCSGKRHRETGRKEAHRNAALCKRGGLPRNDEKGRDPLHAGAGAGPCHLGRSLNCNFHGLRHSTTMADKP